MRVIILQRAWGSPRRAALCFALVVALLPGVNESVLAQGDTGQLSLERASESHGDDTDEGGGYWSKFIEIPRRALNGTNDDSFWNVRTATLSALAAGLAFRYDGQIRDWWQRKARSSRADRISHALDESATPATGFAAAGIGWTVGLMTGDPYLVDTVSLTMQSVLLTQGITWFAKETGGRERPIHSPDDAHSWGEDGNAFFSGHASGSWATATTIARRYPDKPWLQATAYTWASAVAVSRVHDDKHWTSDVIVGSLMGYATARVVVASYPDERRDRISWTPVVTPRLAALGLRYEF